MRVLTLSSLTLFAVARGYGESGSNLMAQSTDQIAEKGRAIAEISLDDIKFKEWSVAGNSLKFGIALPAQATGSDFIGRISGNGIGWGGIGLGPGMTNYLLIVAEPSGGSVTGSIHRTMVRSTPPVFSSPGVSLRTIAKGTSSSGRNWQYTFLCRGCLQNYAAFNQSSNSGSISWGYGSSPKLNLHTRKGKFQLSGLSEARSGSYSAWSASL